jgi:hypothetical protein
MVLRGPNCALRRIAAVVFWWGQLVLDSVVCEVVFDFLWAFVIESVEHRLEAATGQDFVDILYSFQKVL